MSHLHTKMWKQAPKSKSCYLCLVQWDKTISEVKLNVLQFADFI